MQDKLRDSQLRVLWSSRIDYSRNSGLRPHAHEEFSQLMVVIDGEGELQIGEKTYPILPKSGYFFPRGEVHSFIFSRTSSVIDFKFQVTDTPLQRQLVDQYLSEPFSVAQTLHDFKELFHLSSLFLKNDDILLPYRIDVGFKSALLSLIQEQQQKTIQKEHAPILSADLPGIPVVQYLRDNLRSKISLDEVARHFGFHPHYLVDLFKKHLGISPMRYLQQLRLEKAKEYLEFSRLSIKEVADRVGLTPFYLSRLFAEREGISLTQYREQTRTVVGKDITLEEDFSLAAQPMRWEEPQF